MSTSILSPEQNTRGEKIFSVKQLTALPAGASLDYFRFTKQLPGGWVLARGVHEHGNLLALHPESGTCRPLPIHYRELLRVRPDDGRAWWVDADGSAIWSAVLPDGKPKRLIDTPPFLRPQPVASSVSCDGRYLYYAEGVAVGGVTVPIPTTNDPKCVWEFLNRPRNGTLKVMNLSTGKIESLFEMTGYSSCHVEGSPITPSLIRFCEDRCEMYHQRVWTMTLENRTPKRCRPQAYGEMVTHEFWWDSQPNWVGYTYQDRRGDDTIERLPWAEYSPRPTQLGIADENGREVYLSEPLNSYHTHLLGSPDGKWVAGEGTEHNSFVHLAPFSLKNRQIDLKPVAAIHEAYIPFRGQRVEACFSGDSRWLLFNYRVGTVFQVGAVEVKEY